MENLNFKFITNELKNGEMGYSNIFHEYYTGKIFVLNIETSYGYYWDETTKLYKTLGSNSMIPKISELLIKIMDVMITKITENDLFDEDVKAKKCKEFMTHKSRFGSSAVAGNVYKFLLSKYVNEELVKQFNNNENVLPIKTGKIINLATGAIAERNDTHYFTYEMDVTYLGYGDEHSPKTINFFKSLSCNNIVKYKYLRLIFGSSITTDIKMKCFFILYGSKGNNGKSTLLSLMQKVFCDKYVALDQNLLFAEGKDKVSNIQFGSLIGKTISSCLEPTNKYIHGEVIKTLTGGDNISGKQLYCNPVTFMPVVKIFIALNNVIRIKDDAIMKKRTRVINFDAEFIDNPRTENQFKGDKDIESKFMNEYKNDFFTFIVNGAIDYLKMENRNLDQPKELEFEVNNYFKKMDYIGKFLDEHYMITNKPKDRVIRPDVKRKYSEYCMEIGQKFNERAFFQYMTDKFGEAKKDAPGNYCFHGIREKTEAELEAELAIAQDEENKLNDDAIEEIEQVEPTHFDKQVSTADIINKLTTQNSQILDENHKLLMQNKAFEERIRELEQMIEQLKMNQQPTTFFDEEAFISQLIG